MQYPDIIDMLGLSNNDGLEEFTLQDTDLPRSQWIRKVGNKWYIYSKRTHKRIGNTHGYSSRTEAKSAFVKMMKAKWGSK